MARNWCRRYYLVASIISWLVVCGAVVCFLKFPEWQFPSLFCVLIFVLVLLWTFPKWQASGLSNEIAELDRFTCENEARRTIAQISGGLFLILGIYSTWGNLKLTEQNQHETQRATKISIDLSRQAQITERFSKAAAQLSDTGSEVRLGAIYALQGVDRDLHSLDANSDSKEFHWTIVEILTAYIRLKLPLTDTRQLRAKKYPPLDIITALKVLALREPKYKNGEGHRLVLSNTDLRWIDLNQLQANLWGADLSGANLSYANLSGAYLREAKLGGAYLLNTNLSASHLDDAWLDDKTRLDGADLTQATLDRAHLEDTDLTKVKGLKSEQLGRAKTDGAKLPYDLR